MFDKKHHRHATGWSSERKSVETKRYSCLLGHAKKWQREKPPFTEAPMPLYIVLLYLPPYSSAFTSSPSLRWLWRWRCSTTAMYAKKTKLHQPSHWVSRLWSSWSVRWCVFNYLPWLPCSQMTKWQAKRRKSYHCHTLNGSMIRVLK